MKAMRYTGGGLVADRGTRQRSSAACIGIDRPRNDNRNTVAITVADSPDLHRGFTTSSPFERLSRHSGFNPITSDEL
jgi:hypothetical protein